MHEVARHLHGSSSEWVGEPRWAYSPRCRGCTSVCSGKKLAFSVVGGGFSVCPVAIRRVGGVASASEVCMYGVQARCDIVNDMCKINTIIRCDVQSQQGSGIKGVQTNHYPSKSPREAKTTQVSWSATTTKNFTIVFGLPSSVSSEFCYYKQA